jgi:hypothetical protein
VAVGAVAEMIRLLALYAAFGVAIVLVVFGIMAAVPLFLSPYTLAF